VLGCRSPPRNITPMLSMSPVLAVSLICTLLSTNGIVVGRTSPIVAGPPEARTNQQNLIGLALQREQYQLGAIGKLTISVRSILKHPTLDFCRRDGILAVIGVYPCPPFIDFNVGRMLKQERKKGERWMGRIGFHHLPIEGTMTSFSLFGINFFFPFFPNVSRVGICIVIVIQANSTAGDDSCHLQYSCVMRMTSRWGEWCCVVVLRSTTPSAPASSLKLDNS